MYAGDEYLSDEDQNPELNGGDGGPLDVPCLDCGAEPGEECRRYCPGTA